MKAQILPKLPMRGVVESASEVERSVQRLIDAPGRTSGDLRQTRRLTQGVPTVALLEVSYSYTREVLEQRWAQVRDAHAVATAPARARVAFVQ